jgi:hypothetical protein
MKYMLLIHQGTALDGWENFSQDKQNEFYAGYRAVNETPGFTPGIRMQSPETATTVRVEDGETLVTDGPFAETKEALGGYCFFEADDLEAAVALAARIPAARFGGAVEVRELIES